MRLVVLLILWAVRLSWSQAPVARPRFEIADVHVSPKRELSFSQFTARGDRYEVKGATMLDLVDTAYPFDDDKILGGPIWLETDRFDVLAKMPKDTPKETQELMLRTLLEERFHLKLHTETRQLPTYALTMGKKPQLKPADGEGDGGCKMQSGGPGVTGGMRLFTTGPDGQIQTINLGPGNVITYQCHNLTMKNFAERLHGMGGNLLGASPVIDETGLQGSWNFDIRYSLSFGAVGDAGTDRISIVDAVEKQLGLKLEPRQVPTPVLVVDSVDKQPSANPPGIAEAFPVPVLPTEFEVASIKPVDVSHGIPVAIRTQSQPGGRVNYQNVTLQILISRAFNVTYQDQIVGLPQSDPTVRYDVMAKAALAPNTPPLDQDGLAPLLLNLLMDRFKLKYHTDERPVNSYTLVAAKPKIKKADPANRASCNNGDIPPGSPPGTRVLVCRNVTMAEFADELQGKTRELSWPVLNATELEGRWDFTFSYSTIAGNVRSVEGSAPAAAGGVLAEAAAADPNGGYTLFEALEKQLGLKLVLQKRPAKVFVIDHVELKPTEN